MSLFLKLCTLSSLISNSISALQKMKPSFLDVVWYNLFWVKFIITFIGFLWERFTFIYLMQDERVRKMFIPLIDQSLNARSCTFSLHLPGGEQRNKLQSHFLLPFTSVGTGAWILSGACVFSQTLWCGILPSQVVSYMLYQAPISAFSI